MVSGGLFLYRALDGPLKFHGLMDVELEIMPELSPTVLWLNVGADSEPTTALPWLNACWEPNP